MRIRQKVPQKPAQSPTGINSVECSNNTELSMKLISLPNIESGMLLSNKTENVPSSKSFLSALLNKLNYHFFQATFFTKILFNDMLYYYISLKMSFGY